VDTMDSQLNQIFRFPYTEILGWSVSRYEKFLLCKRQYYYDYYAKYDREYPRETIDLLKKLTSIPLETGSIVHDTIKALLERLLKTEKPVDKSRFIGYAEEMTEKSCKSKKFSEIYYKKIDIVEPGSLFNNIRQSLDNFLNSDRYNWIIEKAVTNKTGWLIEPPGYGETRINDLKAYCKVDFLFPVDGEIYIVDWKTGKQDGKKHKKQLLGYSTFACYHFNITSDKVMPAISYLYPAYSELQMKFDETDIKGFVNSVKTETDEMYGYCKNVEQNLPKDKEEFSKTANSLICGFCNYRELCGEIWGHIT